MDSVFDNALNVGVEKGAAGLVTGLEIEYLSRTSIEASSRTHNIAVLEPSAEDEGIGLGDIEGLTVKLLGLKGEVIGNTLCDLV